MPVVDRRHVTDPSLVRTSSASPQTESAASLVVSTKPTEIVQRPRNRIAPYTRARFVRTYLWANLCVDVARGNRAGDGAIDGRTVCLAVRKTMRRCSPCIALRAEQTTCRPSRRVKAATAWKRSPCRSFRSVLPTRRQRNRRHPAARKVMQHCSPCIALSAGQVTFHPRRSLGARSQSPREPAPVGDEKNRGGLQSMHCVIGRANDLLPLRLGEGGTRLPPN